MRLDRKLATIGLLLLLMLISSVQAADPPTVKRVGEDLPSEKLLIGEIEYIGIKGIQAVLEARIDTGATTTSIHAVDIEEFERDGKPWVRFTVTNPDQEKSYRLELPVIRVAKIKKRGTEGYTRRPAVAANLTLGDVTRRISVNLADRTGFEFPLLIGRDFLNGLAIVDVTKKYTQKRPDGAGEKP